jgi:hypothetical protein
VLPAYDEVSVDRPTETATASSASLQERVRTRTRLREEPNYGEGEFAPVEVLNDDEDNDGGAEEDADLRAGCVFHFDTLLIHLC